MSSWKLSTTMLLAWLLSFAGWPSPAEAQRITMYACADVQLESYGVAASAFHPVLCRGEFSASEPYVVLYAQVAPIRRETSIAVEILDPDGVTAFSSTGVLSPVSASPTSFTFSYVLPLASDVEEITRKIPFLYPIVLSRPARERLGEWTWKLWLAQGPSATLKFTLKP